MSLFKMPCIIFAGGRSSRMGENKAFLPFGQYDSLIKYQVKRLEKIFERVYVSTKDKNKFKSIDANIIEDQIYPKVFAPTSGFFNIFKYLKNDDTFFVISVDTPFVNKNIITSLMQVTSTNYEAIVLRTPSSIHPLCGIYTRALQKPIQKMLEEDNHKLMILLKNSKVKYVDVDDEESLLNLNTPDEYLKAVKILQNKFK
ncbi:molybdenum cofactor guanylyltransferase MobA [Sulfurimonas sp. MAG313]|nr:molybdenum cofactor guanylyltransferase MobA [Sulfurimonas sp. MAG313]MDF1880654.1 molybdenum cofactor guanylyltransferase MobA [Sulfurimonas sp. MAG313]